VYDTRILLSDLRAQRSSSIGSGQAASVIFCETSGRYLTNSTNVTQIAVGTEMLVTGAAKSAPGENSRCGSAVDDTEFRLSFYPDGSSNGARIVLRRPNVAYAIDVDWLTGRTAMSEFEIDSL